MLTLKLNFPFKIGLKVVVDIERIVDEMLWLEMVRYAFD